MRHLYKLLAVALLVSPLWLAQDAQAQAADTLVVEWADNDGFPVINSLRDTILGDTTATGERASANRVYKLRRGGFYFLTERIVNDGFHLQIVGESSPAATNPAVLLKLNREDGSIDDKLLVGQGDVTLKHLIMNGRSDQGNLPYEVIRFDAPNARITIDHVVFEFAQWGIMALYGSGSDVFVTNSHWRNLVSENQKWGGRGMSVWTDVDTLYFENNTYFNIGAVPLQVEGGAANFLWFNHNTLVNIGRNMMWGSWWREAYITNNLIVNGFWHGEEETDFDAERLRQPNGYFAGMFDVTPIPSQYGLDLERQVALVANATYRDQAFMDFYNTTSGDINPDLPDNAFGNVRAQPLISDSTRYYFDTWDNFVYDRHTDGVNPGLANHATDNFGNMIQFITDIRDGAATPTLWYWDPNRLQENISVSWPVPEDLSYTNNQLRTAGLGGFPLGDLNWFPSEMAAWTSQQGSLAEDIRNLTSPAGASVYVGTTEAESGVLGGDAAAMDPPNLLYADLRGGGFIEWTFDVAAAGNYDLAVESRAIFGEKYQHVIVNGTQLDGNNYGTGRGEALHVPDNGPDTWFESIIPAVPFVAGQNIVRIVPSWGFSNHRNVFLKDAAGTNVVELPVVDGVRENMNLECDGDACASGNKFISLGSGTASWNFDTESGQYLVRVYYQAEADQQADVYVNDALHAQGVTFAAASDWTTLDIAGIAFTSGVNKVELRGSGSLSVDQIDLFQIIGTGTSTQRNELPEGYALGQNYPNPFNPTTTIEYQLAAPGAVRIAVYDMLGRHVQTLFDGQRSSGAYQVTWNGRASSGQPVASGVYFYRMETPVGVQVRNMVLLK